MKRESLFGGQFHWFAGEVKEIGDHNRVKVRAFGYHNSGVDTAHLPWATVMMPTTVAGTAYSSANHHLEEGSWVIGFFTDGSSAQDPVVIGSITGDDYAGGTEKKKVYKSQGGHEITMDNEPGDIKVKHESGSYIKITPEDIKVKHESGSYIKIDKDGLTTVFSKDDIILTSGSGKKTRIY